jgi:hypothetical protein
MKIQINNKYHLKMSKLHKKTGSMCMICDELLINEKSIVLHKTRRQTHSLCMDCGVGYLKPVLVQAANNIRKNLLNGAESIKCPGSIHCEHRNLCNHISSLLELVVPECEISLDVFRLTYVLTHKNAYICPEMKCGYIVDVDTYYVGNNLVCHGGCQTSWCRNCLVSPYHKGKSCIEVEADNKNTDNGKLIWELKRNGKLKFCPQCKVPCIKHNGCNKMSCAVCNHKWCWICLETNIDYAHYNTGGGGACNGLLWEGVDENGNALPDNQDNDNVQPIGNPPLQRQFPVAQPRRGLPEIPIY